MIGEYESTCVPSWTGAGSGAGNSVLAQQGADELSDVTRLDDLVQESVVPPPVDVEAFGNQLTLDI